MDKFQKIYRISSTRFNDHIIRDYKSHQRIRNYIIDNPKNWDNDKFYK
ncbi:MAG: hypothetical protein KAT38_07260 [Bacteroidales bacterium]|nr:hypothetical protein [Bacteroidales bacterium]